MSKIDFESRTSFSAVIKPRSVVATPPKNKTEAMTMAQACVTDPKILEKVIYNLLVKVNTL